MSRLLTVNEVADELAVSPVTIQRWAKKGAIPHVRLPGRNGVEYRFDMDEVRLAFSSSVVQ